MHYTTALSDSWKEQLLLNIVKTRYGDPPAFMEVASVVAGYSLETGVHLGGEYSPADLRGDTFVGGGVSGKYTDRPTVSYAPMSGEEFVHSLMAPVPLDSLMFMIQGGVPVERILTLTAHAIEGYRNSAAAYGVSLESPDPEFVRVLWLMGRLQHERASEVEVVRAGDNVKVWLRFDSGRPSEAPIATQISDLKALLGIPSDLHRVEVVFGHHTLDDGAVAIRTRSLMQILGALEAGVQIPADHVTDGRAIPGAAGEQVVFTVHSGEERPEEPFVAVPYNGFWFWIDQRDFGTKSTLATVTMLFNFLEGGAKALPILTIPAT